MFSLTWLLDLLPTWMPWAIIFFGIFLFAFETLFDSLIPVMYKLPVKVGAILLFALGFYMDGRQDVLVNAKKEIEKTVDNQQVVTKEVVKYIHDKIIEDRVIHDQIIKEITTADDHMCTVPESFVSVHDSSAKGSVSGLSERVAGTDSGIALSEVERTISENYELYHELADKMRAMQMWLQQQKKINP